MISSFVLKHGMLLYEYGDSVRQSLDETVKSRLNEDEKELSELFRSRFSSYKDAIESLNSGVQDRIEHAGDVLNELAELGIQPAIHEYAVMLLRNVMSSALNSTKEGAGFVMDKEDKDDVEEAIEILRTVEAIKPIDSFVLGIIKGCNIGGIGQFASSVDSTTPWQKDLIHVISIARSVGFMKRIPQDVFKSVNHKSEWATKICTSYMQRNSGILEKMAEYSLYEIAMDMLSQQRRDPNTIGIFLRFLSERGFFHASYSYAVGLLQAKIGTSITESIEEILGYLENAISRGHRRAEFLLAVLPFKYETSPLLESELVLDCIRKLERCAQNSSDFNSVMDRENLKKAVYCLAAEYYIGSSLVHLNKKKAEKLLSGVGLYDKLAVLQEWEGRKQIKEGNILERVTEVEKKITKELDSSGSSSIHTAILDLLSVLHTEHKLENTLGQQVNGQIFNSLISALESQSWSEDLGDVVSYLNKIKDCVADNLSRRFQDKLCGAICACEKEPEQESDLLPSFSNQKPGSRRASTFVGDSSGIGTMHEESLTGCSESSISGVETINNSLEKRLDKMYLAGECYSDSSLNDSSSASVKDTASKQTYKDDKESSSAKNKQHQKNKSSRAGRNRGKNQQKTGPETYLDKLVLTASNQRQRRQ